MTTCRFLLTILLLLSMTPLGGCSPRIVRSASSSSLSEVIEPVQESRMIPEKRALTLPASVAIVVIPDSSKNYYHIPVTTLRQAADKLRLKLLENTRYVASVAIAGAEESTGKISLETIRKQYGADIVIIISYQQDQHSSQSGAAGFMDATIAGIFLFPGVTIATSTVVDGKVVHIPSNAIIFRSSGTDNRSSHSTTYAVESNALEESGASMLSATDDLGSALGKALTKFDSFDFSKAALLSEVTQSSPPEGTEGKPANNYWKKVDTYKSSGGGAFGTVPLLISLAACAAAWRRK